MSGIAADADPSNIRSTGRERKCGTCRNMTVKPPEVELAKYALPIGACAPGVKCLGGAVRGMCQALGVMVESTSMVPNVPCQGRSYVPGGPSIHGTEGMDEQTRAAVMGLSGSMNTGGAARAGGQIIDDGAAAIALAFVGVLAGPAMKWALDRVRGSGSMAEDYTRTTQSAHEPTDWDDRPPRGPELKPGRYLLDPNRRVVTVVRSFPDGTVEVQLAGPHGTHVKFPVSAMRPPWVDATRFENERDAYRAKRVGPGWFDER
jgi:hypothetical protein